MIVISEWFTQVDDMLPENVKAKSFSVYPMPYSGYFELWIEADNGKKYRGLCTRQALISELSEFVLPGNLQGVTK